MIGTIRKHSSWLWIVIAGLTIISFVVFMGAGPARNGNAGGGGNFGTIYGKKITTDEYNNAERETDLSILFRTGTWPGKNPNYTAKDLERDTFFRLFFIRKAEQLDIHVGDQQAADEAANILAQFSRGGETVSLPTFVQQVLQPEGLTAGDFERFARHQLAIQQIIQLASSPGTLVTPQEAKDAYASEHQEISAQIVFFSISNYLSQIAVPPEAVAQFYTNYLAAYRLPDRRQISYVEFSVSDYLARAKKEETNLDQIVEAQYPGVPAGYFPNAKTPDEVKAALRNLFLRQRALADARVQADEFANEAFSLVPAKPENLATVAKQKGYAVKITPPFSAESSPEGLSAPEDFTKDAFELNADQPLAGPIIGTNGVFVIALDKELPSEIPPLEQIHARVTRDFQIQEASALAQHAGTNFVDELGEGLAAGKTFASVCVAAGLHPQNLEPFSLDTGVLGGLGGRVSLDDLKQVASGIPAGHASGFEQTPDGGFVLFVQSRSPLDQEISTEDLLQFTDTLRRSREADAFNQWWITEINRDLRDTRLFKEATAQNKSE